jgi:hypothetical protein
MLEHLRQAIEAYAAIDQPLPLDIWAMALMWGMDPEGVYDSYRKSYTKEEILHNG